MQNKGYPPEFVDQVRNASNIVDIARSYLPLRQKGQNFWACCPFHSEKTPSFTISAPKQFYYCYGCHTSGNVFSLVMHFENLTWIEAVTMLAKKANLELPQTQDNQAWLQASQKRERLYQTLMVARDFYCRNLYLPKNKAALDYLHQRGIDDELIKQFHIGYSDSWQGVIDELKHNGISEQIMKDAGIVATKSDGGHLWDAQFERITFAIHDVYGNCIGFTGRTMQKDDHIAKYKNTAETSVFNKSNIVYGIDVMKNLTRGQHLDGLIVVEGNVDEIAMVKNGFTNTIACMGTALTKFHAGIIARFGQMVYLCFDGDKAGQNATLKSIDTLQDAGLKVKVVVLPDGQDPDEFLQTHGAAAMRQMLTDSIGGLEFKLEYVKKQCDLTSKVGKTDYLNKVVALLVPIESAAERELYLPDIAKTVGIGIEAIRNTVNLRVREFANSKKAIVAEKQKNTIYSGNNVDNKHNIQSKIPDAVIKAEQIIIKAFLHRQPYAKFTDFMPQFSNEIYQKIVTQDLKLNEIDDKLEATEIQIIKPLLSSEYGSPLSEQDQAQEWLDCLNVLQMHQLVKARDATKDLAEKAALTKQIQALKQKTKVGGK